MVENKEKSHMTDHTIILVRSWQENRNFGARLQIIESS